MALNIPPILDTHQFRHLALTGLNTIINEGPGGSSSGMTFAQFESYAPALDSSIQSIISQLNGTINVSATLAGGSTSANQTNGTQKTQIVDGSGVVAGTLNAIGQNALAVSQTATYFQLSTVNSTTAQLGAGATFTGTIETIFNQQAASILLTSDQNGTLTVNQYIDAAGASLASSYTYSVTAGVGFSRCVIANGNYFRLTFQNTGGSSTTTLNVNTAFGTLPAATQLGNAPVAIQEIASGVTIPVSLAVNPTIANTSFISTQATAANLNATVVGTGTLAVQNTAATPAGTNLIGKVTTSDGTNSITIKPASTASISTDTAQVVALSPNTPLPAGANAIGAVTTTQLASTLGAKTTANSPAFNIASDQLLATGQATMANSQPVVQAFDSPTLPTSPNIPVVISPLTNNFFSATGTTSSVQVIPGAWYAISVGKTYTAAVVTGTYSGASGATVLTTASTTGVFLGQQIVGTSVPKGSVVTAVVTNTSITISLPITALISAATLSFTAEQVAFTFQSSPDNSAWNSLNAVIQSSPSLQQPASTQYFSGIYLVQAPITTTGNSYIRVNIGTLTNATLRFSIDPFTLGSKVQIPYNLPVSSTQANWPTGACHIPILDTAFIQGISMDCTAFSGTAAAVNWFQTNDPLCVSPWAAIHETGQTTSSTPQATFSSSGVYNLQNTLRYFLATQTGTAMTLWNMGGVTATVSQSSYTVLTPPLQNENINQIGGGNPIVTAANGSSNKALGIMMATAVNNADATAVAFAGAGKTSTAVISSTNGGGVAIAADLNFTVTTLGTATALLPFLEESYDNGTTWTTIWTGTPFTTSSHQRCPGITIYGRRRWGLFSVGGTSTTVPGTITAMELPAPTAATHQLVDVYSATNPYATLINGATFTSALVSTTASSTSSACIIEGCKFITIGGVFTGGTPAVAPIYSLQVSNDASNWFTTLVTFTPTAAGTFLSTATNACYKFARLIVTTASTGGTPYTVTYTMIYATA